MAKDTWGLGSHLIYLIIQLCWICDLTTISSSSYFFCLCILLNKNWCSCWESYFYKTLIHCHWKNANRDQEVPEGHDVLYELNSRCILQPFTASGGKSWHFVQLSKMNLTRLAQQPMRQMGNQFPGQCFALPSRFSFYVLLLLLVLHKFKFISFHFKFLNIITLSIKEPVLLMNFFPCNCFFEQ